MDSWIFEKGSFKSCPQDVHSRKFVREDTETLESFSNDVDLTVHTDSVNDTPTQRESFSDQSTDWRGKDEMREKNLRDRLMLKKRSGCFFFDSCDDENVEGQFENGDETTQKLKGKKESTSRKEKSLGLLCQRFIRIILEDTSQGCADIHLESTAIKMQVEKRRIYDIVNVLEALGGMEKANKSYYRWRGLEDLPSLLYSFKLQAIEEDLPTKVRQTQEKMTRFIELPDGGKQAPDIVGTLRKLPVNDDSGMYSGAEQDQSFKSDERQRRNQRPHPVRGGHNSLAHLCKRFLMILISGPDNETSHKVSLDVASTMLIKNPEVDGYDPPNRSRCRRLYDVANVLVSLRMIQKKLYNFGTKKIPLYVYCGPPPSETVKFDFMQHLINHKLSTETEDRAEALAIAKEEALMLEFVDKRDAMQKCTSESANISEDEEEPKRKRKFIAKDAERVLQDVDPNKLVTGHSPAVDISTHSVECDSGKGEVLIQRPKAQMAQPTDMNRSAEFVQSCSGTVTGLLAEEMQGQAEHAFHPPIVSKPATSQPSSEPHQTSSTTIQPNHPQYAPLSDIKQAISQIQFTPNFSSTNSTPYIIPMVLTPYPIIPPPSQPGNGTNVVLQPIASQQENIVESSNAEADIATGHSNANNINSSTAGGSVTSSNQQPSQFSIDSILSNPNFPGLTLEQARLLAYMANVLRAVDPEGRFGMYRQCTRFLHAYIFNFEIPN